MRLIDADDLLEIIEKYCGDYNCHDSESFDKQAVRMAIRSAPTITPPNEPLTLISMSDEIPPDNERVLVYRPCMVNSDTGPYSVQWGWAAKRDGSHWARLPDRRPPEGEEDRNG